MQAIPKGAWVVVADGRGARLLENVGAAFEPSLIQRGQLQPKNLDGEGPSGVQPQELDVDEATFAKQLAQKLNQEALTNAYQHLVLIADPKTLGQVRPLLHKETVGRLVGEVSREMTGARLEDIAKALH